MITNKAAESTDDSIGKKINETLSKLMKDNHVSLSLLHRNTGIAIPTIKRLQSDPSNNPTISTLLPIANFFGISIAQLAGYEPLPSSINGYIENKAHWLRVPIIQWREIQSWTKSSAGIITNSNSSVSIDLDCENRLYALQVEEDDWTTIAAGSILIINSELTPEHKDFVIVHKDGQNTPSLKQLMVDEGNIYLKSMNNFFPPIKLDDSYHFFGVLIQIRKDLKI